MKNIWRKTMEIHIKRTVKAGNSSAVILPRAWLNQEVRVELVKKTPDIILADTLKIIKDYIELKDIIGIYLVGSYARGEEDETSDIDILAITNNIDREMIKVSNYNLLLVSSELLNQKLKQDLLPIGQMVREAMPLLNASYLYSINVEVTRKNIQWYLDTTKDKLNLIKRIIDKINNSKQIDNKLAYTLILRIRTLYIIKKIIENKPYSKNEFTKLINNISHGNNAYETYLDVKNDVKSKKSITKDEAERLYVYLKSQLEKIKKRI